jgi:hypothetical protein
MLRTSLAILFIMSLATLTVAASALPPPSQIQHGEVMNLVAAE